MTQKEQIEAFERIASKFEGKLKKAFLEAAKEAGDRIKAADLEEAINSRIYANVIDESHVMDIEQILLGFGAAGIAFSQYMTNAYMAGAETAQNLLPDKISANLSFDVMNPETVKYLNEYRPQQIKYISDESRDAIAEILRKGYEQGRTTKQIARSIKDSIGLTPSQSQAVSNFRKQLEARSNLGLTPADRRRIDAVARRRAGKQIRTGYMTQGDIDEIVEKYRTSMLNRRAENIARTETSQVVGEGRRELWRQAKSQGLLPDTVLKKPSTAKDERVRSSHTTAARMNKDGVPLDQPYNTPFGPRMGAPYSGEVSCRCIDILIGI